MTLDEFMILYLAFALSGAVVMIITIFLPAMKMVGEIEPWNPLLHPVPAGLAAGVMYILFFLSGPLMIMILLRRESFLEHFVEGILNND